MTTALAPGRQDARSALLGWILATAFAVLFWNIITLPRTPLDQREFLRAFHFSLGLVVGLLCVLRLWWWRRAPAPVPPAGLPPGSFGFNRALLLALVLTFLVETVNGFVYAWADGQNVVLFGWTAPRLIEADRELRRFCGYTHSALGFYYLMLFTVWVVYGVYQHLRYKVGLRRLLPGAAV